MNHLSLLLIISIALWCGCATSNHITNLTPVYLYSEPTITAYENPNARMSWYRTFSVFPYSVLDKETKVNSILEQQLLFYIRNLYEERGYDFVQLDESPDCVVTIIAESQYHETYVPPASITIPQWVSGRTITSQTENRGNLNFSTFGDLNLFGWGSWNQSSTTTTHVPGYMTTQTLNRPGYSVGRHYPVVKIFAYDGNTHESVWNATGIGTSNQSDVRISGQIVMGRMVSRFPSPNSVDQPPATGFIGVQASLFTLDGNSYYPAILEVIEGMPAEKAGVNKNDFIVAIDGTDTRNKPIKEIFGLLRGDIGSQVELSVWRLGEIKKYRVMREPLRRQD